jgi:hydrogenase expression/formation protein HypD
MRFVDEFREPELITKTAEEIRRLADPTRHYRFMEVCGGHTHSIYRFGLKDLLPSNIELVHGPGWACHRQTAQHYLYCLR